MTTGRVRLSDQPADVSESLANAIEEMYDDALDVAVVRRAWQPSALNATASALDSGDDGAKWNRPNAVMPPEDIQVLGTAATPTYSTPRGPTLDTYLGDADWYEKTPLFGRSFDPTEAVTASLARHSGGRPVEILYTPDRRRFSPFTIRRLVEGKGIGLHHDLHLSLSMFADVAAALDATTLVSWVFTLQGPQTGGELVVYDCAPDTPDPPKMPNGFSWDLAGVENRFDSVRIETGPGDLFFFPSARLLHRVSPVAGPKARITLGGFLALDRNRERVVYWS
jgi:hypothetical protein